jgi:fluoroacetyl-CoA thioesterase
MDAFVVYSDSGVEAACHFWPSQRGASHEVKNMQSIPLRAKGSFTLVVKLEHLASRFKDSMLPPVLATPIMVLAMENAALNAIREYLGPGESAVGTAVDIHHLAATPLGMQVTAEAEVTKVDGRRIVFAVTARDEVEEIGRGTHERMMIDLRRVMQRLDVKAGRRSTAADAD